MGNLGDEDWDGKGKRFGGEGEREGWDCEDFMGWRKGGEGRREELGEGGWGGRRGFFESGKGDFKRLFLRWFEGWEFRE